MCHPAVFAAGMAGAQLAQGLGQRDAIKQQNEIAKGIAKTNERNAIEAAARDSQVFAQQEKQADFQATTAAREKSVEAALVKGASRAGSGSGTGGLHCREAPRTLTERLEPGRRFFPGAPRVQDNGGCNSNCRESFGRGAL